MNPKLLATIALACALAPCIAAADSGLFLSGSVGQSRLSEDFDGFDVDDDSTAWRLTAGFRFNDHFALEGGYHNFGRFEETVDLDGAPVNVSLKADGFTFGGTGSLPVGERLHLFARAGLFFWDGDADINGATEATPGDTNLYLGAGVRFDLSERVSLTADGSRYNLDDTTGIVLSAGFELRF